MQTLSTPKIYSFLDLFFVIYFCFSLRFCFLYMGMSVQYFLILDYHKSNILQISDGGSWYWTGTFSVLVPCLYIMAPRMYRNSEALKKSYPEGFEPLAPAPHIWQASLPTTPPRHDTQRCFQCCGFIKIKRGIIDANNNSGAWPHTQKWPRREERAMCNLLTFINKQSVNHSKIPKPCQFGVTVERYMHTRDLFK